MRRSSLLFETKSFLWFRRYLNSLASGSIIVRSTRYWISSLIMVHSARKNSLIVRISILKAFKICWYFLSWAQAAKNWSFKDFFLLLIEVLLNAFSALNVLSFFNTLFRKEQTWICRLSCLKTICYIVLFFLFLGRVFARLKLFATLLSFFDR